MKILTTTNNYTPVAYTNQKTKAFAQSTETNLLGEERPKNAQLKSLGRSGLFALATFGILAAGGKLAKNQNALTNAAFVATLAGEAETGFNPNYEYKLEADEKIVNASVIGLLGAGLIKGIQKLFPAELTKNPSSIAYKPLEGLAYFTLTALVLIGLYENVKNASKRKSVNDKSQTV